MIKQIFVNLSVKDLNKSMEFWKHLGFEFNPQFTDENVGALVLGENIFAMLLTEKFFKGFTPNFEIADASKVKEVLNAISVDSREKVDEIFGKAIEAGGREFRPAEDHGWMYARPFEDIDGHVWELLYMDMVKLGDQKPS